MQSPVLRRLAVGLVVPAVLALAACGASEASRSDVQGAFEDSGVDAAQAECVTDSLFADLDQDQIDELYEAGEDDEVGGEIEDAVDAAITECASAG